MNRDPSLIPRLCEMQWQPRISHILCPINCYNPPSSTGFHPAYDDSLFLISSNLLHIMYHSMPVLPPCAAPPPWDAPSYATIWKNWYFWGFEQDPLDNVKQMILISSLCFSTLSLQHIVLTGDHVFIAFCMSLLVSHSSRYLLSICLVTVTAVCCQSKHQGKE